MSRINNNFKKKHKNEGFNLGQIIRKWNGLTDDEEKDNDEEEENVDEQSITILAEIIKELTFLFALFSNEYYYDCDDLEKCINNCLRYIDKFTEFCDCKNDIYICYINNTGGKPFNKNQLKQFLIMFIKLLENDDLKNVLKFIFNSIKTKMTSNPLIYDMSENDIMDTIKQYLPIREKEKNENGEVFTPYELINEMLDKLPDDVWFDPDLKWLDPANGIGNFPMVVYGRLMGTLEGIDGLENKKTRHTHIIRNMLYMVELNPRNIEISRRIFGEDANIYCGDFLEEKWKDKFKVDEFDIVVGNPPFQEVDNITGKSKGGTNLYTKFINNSINFLKNNGYLLFITPISWLGPSTNKQSGGDLLHNVFLKYDLLFLNLNECKKYFNNIGSTFSYFLIRKSVNNIFTKIISKYNNIITESEINLKNYYFLKFLPIHISNETLTLIKYITTGKNKLKIERSRKLDTSTSYGKEHLKDNETDIFKYITYHTSTKTKYSDIKLEDYKKSKILLNMSGYLYPDIQKNCNVTESKFYIIVEDMVTTESDKILNMLKNDENIINYLKLCKYSGFNSRIVLENISYD